MKNALIDTGPLIALFDESDKYNKKVRSFLKKFQGSLFTTEAVITEVSYYFSGHKHAQLYILEWVAKGAVKMISITNQDFYKIHSYMKKYHDTPMDYADATLLIAAEKINSLNIITLDSDFYVYKYSNGKVMNNLLQVNI